MQQGLTDQEAKSRSRWVEMGRGSYDSNNHNNHNNHNIPRKESHGIQEMSRLAENPMALGVSGILYVRTPCWESSACISLYLILGLFEMKVDLDVF